MTRSSRTNSETGSPTLVCRSGENGFHTSADVIHRPNDAEHGDLITVRKLVCNAAEPYPPLSKLIMLQNGHADSTFSKTLCNGFGNGQLKKTWKSVGVLCEKEATKKLLNHSKRQPKSRGKNGIRSCERECETSLKTSQNFECETPLSLGNESNELTSIHASQLTSTRERPCEDSSSSDSGKEDIHHTALSNAKPNTSSELDINIVEVKQHTACDSREDTRSLCVNGISTENSNSSEESTTLTESSDSNTILKPLDLDEDSSKPIDKPDDEFEEDISGEQTEMTQENKTNLIVNYLPQNMTQEEIRSLFSTIGEVDSCKLIRDKNTSQNLGYGFVNYIHSKDAERAIATLNGFQLQNKTIKVSLARPSSESIKGANLYISGLPVSMSQQQLEDMFNSCGRIITSRILYDSNTGLSRGVGFIRFDQRVEAEEAIRKLNGVIPANATEPITVKLANSPSSTTHSSTVTSGNDGKHTLNGFNYFTDISTDLGSTDGSVATAMAVKPHQAALTMFLLQQMHRFPRLGPSGALLHHPYQYPHPRLPRQSYFPRQFNPAPRRFLTSSASAATGIASTQHATPANQHPGQTPASRISNRLANSTTTSNGTTSSSTPIVPTLFPTQPHVFSTMPTHNSSPMLYQRCRFPPILPGMLGSPTNLSMNGFTQPPPIPPNPVPFAGYSITEQNGHLPHQSDVLNGFPFNPFNSAAFVGSPGLGSDPSGLLNPTQISMGIAGINLPGSFPTPFQGLTSYTRAPIPVGGNYTNMTPWCLFLCNLPPDIEEATLWRLFGPFGAVRSVKVIRDPNSNRCRGIGFVNMTNYSEALLAIQNLNGLPMGNRHLQVTMKLPMCGDLMGVPSMY